MISIKATHTERKIELTAQILQQRIIRPVFVSSEIGKEKVALKFLPGQFALGLSVLAQEIEELLGNSYYAFCLFEIFHNRSHSALNESLANSILPKAISLIRNKFPNLPLVVDHCLCQYTQHAHCGILNDNSLDNSATLKVLAELGLKYVESGCEIIMPSSMIDGMVATLRNALDKKGHRDVLILSQSAKSDSALYGPFRLEAHQAGKSLQSKASYQLPVANFRESLHELIQDSREGADLLLIKPALLNLDLLRQAKEIISLPIGAFITSGEHNLFSCFKNQQVKPKSQACDESLIKRVEDAGADFVIAY